jgi:hypothetical protein
MKTNHKLKIDYKGCHEGLWNWLADNPDKEKEEWPGLKTIDMLRFINVLPSANRPIHFSNYCCFACESTPSRKDGSVDCSQCPVDFGKTDCISSGSYYDCWYDQIDRSANARKIAQGWTK